MIGQEVLSSSISAAPIFFSATWQLLGPFQIGTREATWGADPLEYIGGFRSLTYDENATFYSSLATNGTVGWSTTTANLSTTDYKSAKANLIVSFEQTDWVSLQSVYGWAALQYQAWARGKIQVDGDMKRTVILYTDQVLEFWVDDEYYFGGDFYAYRRAPLVLHLDPGEHRIDLRITRDVRAMGGVGEPTVSIGLEAEISDGGLRALEKSMLLPDMVEGKLVSPLGSVNLRNEENYWIDVSSVESVDITYKQKNSANVCRTNVVTHVFHPRKSREPQKITYLHRAGIVSYAVLRPPSEEAIRHILPDIDLPVLLGLHGAGVETDSDMVRHAFDDGPDLRAWALYPSGVTTWSGDDWRQGAWYALTHAPDKIIGAAPVSAYSSIQAYIPYLGWNEADPAVVATLQSALADYQHELLLENSCGIPLHQQHGSLDENVPPFHSRRLRQLLSQVGCPSKYVELPGKGHWFEGVMTTQNLLGFYDKILKNQPAERSLPRSFSIVTANPGTMGSKGGIIIDQLGSPGLFGKIKALYDGDARLWRLLTSNIHRLHFSKSSSHDWLGSELMIDGKVFKIPANILLSGPWLVRSPNGSWEV
ncbi:MAG: hypothetical protein Q9182_000979 [Xanthomendoza sp. 2 TL-2023]